jgi:hypothetical protein
MDLKAKVTHQQIDVRLSLEDKARILAAMASSMTSLARSTVQDSLILHVLDPISQVPSMAMPFLGGFKLAFTDLMHLSRSFGWDLTNSPLLILYPGTCNHLGTDLD